MAWDDKNYFDRKKKDDFWKKFIIATFGALGVAGILDLILLVWWEYFWK